MYIIISLIIKMGPRYRRIALLNLMGLSGSITKPAYIIEIYNGRFRLKNISKSVDRVQHYCNVVNAHKRTT